MNSIQIECFLAAAESLSFTKAAEQLYISQPTLSRNIALLELELELDLFIRGKRQPIRLTPAGVSLYTSFSQTKKSIMENIEKARKINQGYLSTLRLGLLEGQMIDDKLRKILFDFEKEYSDVEIQYGRYTYLLEELMNERVDMGITLLETVEKYEELLYEPLYYQPTVLTMHQSLLRETKEVYHLADFREEYFITNGQKEFQVYNEKLVRLCREAGFVPRCLEAPNLQTQSLWVEMGRGIVGYNPMMSIMNSSGIVGVPVHEFPDTLFVAAWKKNNYNTAISKFVQFVRQNIQISQED